MLLKTLFDLLKSSRKAARRTSRRKPRWCGGLERLEDRCVLDSTFSSLLANEHVDVLQVTSLTPTETGFTARFNRPIDLAVDDVLLIGPSGEAVQGTLALEGLNSVTFTTTEGVLEPGIYSVTLRSGDPPPVEVLPPDELPPDEPSGEVPPLDELPPDDVLPPDEPPGETPPLDELPSGDVFPPDESPSEVSPLGGAFLGVESVVINDGSAQRSMVMSITVTFGGETELPDGTFELFGPAGPVGLGVDARVEGGRTVAVLTFSGSDTIAGSLVDGGYALIVHTDSGDHVEGFFRLFGDTDGDGFVGGDYIPGTDPPQFTGDLAAFNETLFRAAGESGYLWFLDFNGDGRHTGQDYFEFIGRFGRGL